MKIQINIRILLMILISFIFDNVDTYIIFLIFTIVHEIAHLIVGMIIGGKPKTIRIEPFGVSLEIYSYSQRSSLLKILFYLVGPLINLIIAIIFMRIIHIEEVIRTKIVYINLLIFLFNMLPIMPLDGGRILREILFIIFKENKCDEILFIISKFFLLAISFTYSILIIKIKNIYILFLIIYLWYLNYVESKRIMLYNKARKIIVENNKKQ